MADTLLLPRGPVCIILPSLSFLSSCLKLASMSAYLFGISWSWLFLCSFDFTAWNLSSNCSRLHLGTFSGLSRFTPCPILFSSIFFSISLTFQSVFSIFPIARRRSFGFFSTAVPFSFSSKVFIRPDKSLSTAPLRASTNIRASWSVMLAGLSWLPILSLSVLLLLRCRRSRSIFLSPAVTAGELTPTVLRTCTERVWWCCDAMWPKREILCAGVRLCNCAVLDGGEWSSFSSGSSNFGCLMCGISPRKVS